MPRRMPLLWRAAAVVGALALALIPHFALSPKVRHSPSLPSGAALERLRRQLPHAAFARRWRSAAAGASPAADGDATAAAASPAAACPPSRKPYHVVLTASSGAYQLWQSRIFYYHYVRVKREGGPCSEVGGFTRLLTQPAGAPHDALVPLMRTVVVTELTPQQTLGFVVLNRPHSMVEALGRPAGLKGTAAALIEREHGFVEDYLFVAETDHLLMKPLPNLASPAEGLGYPFHYMEPTRDAKTIALVRRFAGTDGAAAAVQKLGPSPVLMHVDAMRKLAKEWLDISFELKRDPAADAEFGWMLEMWGYSIAAGRVGVRHKLLEAMQLEPSSQFGTRITDAAGSPTHYVLHYTFSHEYSLEGVPMIDSRNGQWAFDKRPYKELPRHLLAPPRCALESTRTLWRLLHDAMAAHDTPATCHGCTGNGAPWANSSERYLRLVDHDTTARGRIAALTALDEAALLVGTGPWTLRAASGTPQEVKRSEEGPFYFLRGGQLHTPYGSAAWGNGGKAGETDDPSVPPPQRAMPEIDGDPIVLYFCGRHKPTHSLRVVRDGAAPGGWRLVVTSRPGGEVRFGTLHAASANATLRSTLRARRAGVPGGSDATGDAAGDAAAAIVATDRAAADGDASSVRRRLVGTGPWRLGSLLDTYLLRDGAVFSGVWPRAGRDAVGSWSVEHGAAAHGRGGIVTVSVPGHAPSRWSVDCWRLTPIESSGRSPAAAELVWAHPASRCFPTCSDATHPLAEHETGGLLASLVMTRSYSWAGNREGMRFTFSKAEGGVLVTPWGHGTWGVVPSRADVLVAEFAQQRHMLKFDAQARSFVSTRCADGEVVPGSAL